MKLDFGSGPNPKPGFEGVDQYGFDGVVAHVCDVTIPEVWLAWEESSCEEAHASHFVEHLTGRQRILFFNQLWRIMKPGAKATIITPHWGSNRAYGDPTHQWPPVSEMSFFYLNKEWRKTQAPHTDFETTGFGFTCDFEASWGYDPHPALAARNSEYQQYAIQWFKESAQDMHATLTCRK